MSMGAPEAPAVWEAQFERAEDFPPTPVRHRLVLCSTPRCGSHYLGHRLRAAGLGYPLEYVNAANLMRWRTRAAGEAAQIGAPAPLSPLDHVKRHRTAPGGIFAIKVHHNQLAAFLAEEPDPLGCRFVLIERDDMLAQAVSYAWAAQTGAWISGMAETGTPRYDRTLIAEKLEAIAAGRAGWRAFLAANAIRPLSLSFEHVRAEPAAAVAAIAAYLGLDPSAHRLPDTEHGFAPRAQSDGRKRDWAQRFVEQTAEALSAGQAVPGHTPQHARPAKPRSLQRVVGRVMRRIRRRKTDPGPTRTPHPGRGRNTDPQTETS
ncbi:MAG: Stf0 family sulfotransferase [Pseudomonadota bacterium]